MVILDLSFSVAVVPPFFTVTSLKVIFLVSEILIPPDFTNTEAVVSSACTDCPNPNTAIVAKPATTKLIFFILIFSISFIIYIYPNYS